MSTYSKRAHTYRHVRGSLRCQVVERENMETQGIAEEHVGCASAESYAPQIHHSVDRPHGDGRRDGSGDEAGGGGLALTI